MLSLTLSLSHTHTYTNPLTQSKRTKAEQKHARIYGWVRPSEAGSNFHSSRSFLSAHAKKNEKKDSSVVLPTLVVLAALYLFTCGVLNHVFNYQSKKQHGFKESEGKKKKRKKKATEDGFVSPHLSSIFPPFRFIKI